MALLPSWYDVDTAPDLDRLRAEIATLPPDAVPHTATVSRRELMQQSNTEYAIRNTQYTSQEHHPHDHLQPRPPEPLRRPGGGTRGRTESGIFTRSGSMPCRSRSTDACPQGCIYCYAGSTPQETRGLTSDEIRGLLEDAAALEIRAIDWLGGDPLVRPDWYELMSYAQLAGPDQQRLDQRPAPAQPRRSRARSTR